MYKLFMNSKRSSLSVLTALLMTGQFLFLSQATAQQRIKEIASVAGERSNQLIGYGLVVGLDGSGDQTTQSPFTLQSTLAMLQSLGVAIPPAFPFPLTPPAGVELIALFPPPAVMLPNTEEEPLRRSKLALV